MKVRDLIKVMDGQTKILVYCVGTIGCTSEEEECTELSDNCDECEYFDSGTVEHSIFRGTAAECPIKIAEYKVILIDNRTRRIQVNNRGKMADESVISLEVTW